MINSRDIDDLLPRVASKCRAFVAACEAAGIPVLITSTYRDKESQDALYAQGRTAPGPRVTNARGGQSYHQYRVAFDFVPMVAGKAQRSNMILIDQCGKIGKGLGLEWAGDWTGFREWLHFQDTGRLTLAQLAAGQKPA